MSELIQENRNRARWQLLASVSALALVANAASQARAEDTDRPTVWIEAGVQLERLTNGQESFAPPFVTTLLENPFTPPSIVQKPPLYSFGQEGRLSFAPEGSDWVFSAAIRYGRANSSDSSHEETSPSGAKQIVQIPYYSFYFSAVFPPIAKRFATTTSRENSSYLVMDFQAGKDVGLGAFGTGGSSTIQAGVRIAQFTSQSKGKIDSDPDYNKQYVTIAGLGPYASGYAKLPRAQWNLYSATWNVARSFHGIGPSLGWDAAAVLVGHPDTASVTFDWGINGAILFGRQKVTAHHSTMAHHGSAQHNSGALPTLYPTKVHNTARSRSVVVPNIGGFAGLSMRFPNAKVSLGYRIDAFFGAIDGGIDVRKTYDRNFFGPFATISVGLGG